MIQGWIAQHYCLASLLIAAACGLLGCVEYWAAKERRTAQVTWFWGVLIAIPGLVCEFSIHPLSLLAVIGALTLAVALWRQSRRGASA